MSGKYYRECMCTNNSQSLVLRVVLPGSVLAQTQQHGLGYMQYGMGYIPGQTSKMYRQSGGWTWIVGQVD